MIENQPIQPWKTRSRRIILKHSEFLTVESHTVELPDGRVISDWPWLIGPDAAIVLAETMEGEFLCFRQTKYAIPGISLAPVGGHIEPGEDPLDAARRELLEETGYQAADWIRLGSYIVDPNRGLGMRYLFFARKARKVAEPSGDDLEDQQLLALSRTDLETALDKGEFKLSSWAAAVALALRHLHRSNESGVFQMS